MWQDDLILLETLSTETPEKPLKVKHLGGKLLKVEGKHLGKTEKVLNEIKSGKISTN